MIIRMIETKNFEALTREPSGSVVHFWPGHLDVAFVYSAPGKFEADAGRPIAKLTGRHLEAALARHLAPALPSVFASADRYAYRITNAHTRPLARAYGDANTEASDADIRLASNVARVQAELAGCRLVVLCGAKAQLLSKHLVDYPLVLAGHTSVSGLNTRWPNEMLVVANQAWDAMSGPERTAGRIALWAADVERQIRALLRAGAL